MRFWGLLGVFVFVATGLVCLPVAARAQSVTVTQKVEIHAVVTANQYVIINDSNLITEIGSNTSEDVAPKVFLNNLDVSSERPATKYILSQYHQLVSPGKSHPGIMYKRLPEPSARALPLVLRLNISES